MFTFWLCIPLWLPYITSSPAYNYIRVKAAYCYHLLLVTRSYWGFALRAILIIIIFLLIAIWSAPTAFCENVNCPANAHIVVPWGIHFCSSQIAGGYIRTLILTNAMVPVDAWTYVLWESRELLQINPYTSQVLVVHLDRLLAYNPYELLESTYEAFDEVYSDRLYHATVQEVYSINSPMDFSSWRPVALEDNSPIPGICSVKIPLC